jgi:hypothetical protein
VKTLAINPTVKVTANPRIGPVPNWNRKAAEINVVEWVSKIVQKTFENPVSIAERTV